MSQITLYLDDATQALVEQAARANGVSKSRWVAEVIRKHAAQEWPQDCLALAGQFDDFPLRDHAHVAQPAAQSDRQSATYPRDTPRIGF